MEVEEKLLGADDVDILGADDVDILGVDDVDILGVDDVDLSNRKRSNIAVKNDKVRIHIYTDMILSTVTRCM